MILIEMVCSISKIVSLPNFKLSYNFGNWFRVATKELLVSSIVFGKKI